jgi:hypothetical protein
MRLPGFSLTEALARRRIRRREKRDRYGCWQSRRLHLEQLEDRRLLSLVPVTVAIPELIQTDNPDGWPDGDGDYYAKVTIGNSPEQYDENKNIEGSHIYPGWHFTRYVESTAGPVQIQIQIMDADDFLAFSDDLVDVNPASGQTAITLTFDPNSASTLSGSSQGNGDADGDAQVFYDVFRSTPVTVAIPELIQITDPDSGFEEGDGDYYPAVKIGSGRWQSMGDYNIEGSHIYPNWRISDYVPASGGPITIQINVWDSDTYFGGLDDRIDVNPASGQTTITLTYDPTAGTTLSGDSQGNGDAEGDAQVFYTVTPTHGGKIIWKNRGDDEGDDADHFDIFGVRADAARAVVDAAIGFWDRTILDFNQPGKANRLELSISTAARTNDFGAVTTLNSEDNGYPTEATITIDDGDGTPVDLGWFLDDTPYDWSEFSNPINAFASWATSGGPASGLPDLFALVLHEIGHAVGITSDDRTRFYTGGFNTNTGNPDVTQDGIGTYWVFQGPSITHLMTSNNGGPSGSALNGAVHSAADGATVTWSGQTLSGAEDLMNPTYSYSMRTLLPNTMALILKDAYGYEILPPETFGTYYSGTLNQTTGELVINGGSDSGVGSNDTISIRRSGHQMIVTQTVGEVIPGTGSNTFQSIFFAAAVQSVTVNGFGGDDTLTIDFSGGNPLPAGGLTFDGSSGSDSLILQGGSFATVTHSATNVKEGSINLDGSEITYTGLDAIADQTTAAGRVFVDAAGRTSQRIRLRDDGDPNNNISVIDSDSTGNFSIISFVNPVGALTIDAQTGNDRLIVDFGGANPIPQGGLS